MSARFPNFYKFWPVLALFGPAIVLFTTSTVGPGINGDSVRYLSSAQNISAGLGVVDYSLEPLLAWPPLYPAILALLSSLFGDVVIAAWVLNALLFGLNIFLVGKLAENCLPEWPFVPGLLALVTLIFPSLLRLHTAIVSDPLFLALILAFMLFASRFLIRGDSISLNGMLVTAMLASLVKYPGIALMLSGGVIALVRKKRQGGYIKAAGWGLGFSFLAGLPLAAWVLFHNFLRYGSLFGERGSGTAFDNLYITFEKIVYWFLPYSVQKNTGPFIIIGALAVSLFIIIQPTSWRALFQRLINDSFLPISLFFGLYFLMMIFLVSYPEHKSYQVDRLHILLVIPLWLFILALAATTRLRWKPRLPIPTATLLVLTILLWLIYPLYNTVKYIRLSLEHGEIANNLYNTRELSQSDIVAYLRDNPLANDSVIYSNHEGAAWFYLRQNILSMPQGDRNDENQIDLEAALVAYADWPPGEGYIVWFNLPFKQHILPPEALAPLATITPIFNGQGGGLYRVEP